MRLLLAEDTTDLNHAVSVLLTRSGYDVDSVYDGNAASAKLEENGYDAVILDIMMPGKDGLTVLREMRQKSIMVPVLMLTAKSEVDDRVEGLSSGADDYLTKPFAMKELLARINAMTRRSLSYKNVKVNYADFSIDPETLELGCRNSVRLSKKEFELIYLLVSNSGNPLDCDFIIEHIWQNEEGAGANTVDLYIRYLRRKLDGVSSSAKIEGDKGGPYRLT